MTIYMCHDFRKELVRPRPKMLCFKKSRRIHNMRKNEVDDDDDGKKE